MPIEAICPSCGQKLKVSDALVGKKVRCQKCNSVFLAEEEVEMELVEEPPEDHVEVVEGPPPRKRDEQPVRVIDEEAEEVEDEPREQRRPRRRKRRSSNAVEQVRIPALLLQIVAYGGAGLTGLLLLVEIVMIILHPSAVTAGLGSGQGASSGAYQSGAVAGAIFFRTVGLLVTFGWSTALIRGAQSMSSMSGYSNAVGACILAMLPCSCGCFMGLPIGIWGLVVLTQDNVKRAFS
jgi:predicted Zn finger-like uncharacterized protein